MLNFEDFECPYCDEIQEWETNTMQWDDLINGDSEGTQICKDCNQVIKLELFLYATVEIKALKRDVK